MSPAWQILDACHAEALREDWLRSALADFWADYQAWLARGRRG